ncbi:cytochrome b [Gluconacetobacter sp. Hr-1-5]|uniref:cytochrome b n=1 Tax=Gluconacetobacter sp. Hr-1-5 TaxID=3395370 RepID=UPI003B52C2A2
MNDNDTIRHDRRTIALHWTVGVSVIFLWVMAQGAERLPKGSFRLSIWSVHVILGFLLTLLVLLRIAWRATGGRRPSPADRGMHHMPAMLMHTLLYLLLLSVVGLGIANVFGHGFPLFGVWRFPRLWEKSIQHRIADWHGTVANVIMVVAALHAAAACYHHAIIKDNVLRRMLP